MAYNVLKGMVEGSVDQYADQEIGGVKVFKNTISASVFYDTDAQSPCATMKDVAITEVMGGVNNSILTFQGEGKAKAEYNLNFDGRRLTTKEICASNFVGSAKGLYDVPALNISGSVSANSLNLGAGVHSVRGRLQVRAGRGINVSAEGVSVAVEGNSGLTMKGNNLVVEPKNCLDITLKGQNLSDDDVVMVHDSSRNETRKTSLSNLYNSYINSKAIHPEGSVGSLQLRGRKGLNASANLTYCTKDNILKVAGETQTTLLSVLGQSTFQGPVNHRSAVHHNITSVSEGSYGVSDTDYTILGDTTKSKVTIVLPPACNHRGRQLIIKKVNKDKYKLNSNTLTIDVDEGLIDFADSITIKYNNSSRVVQSDGENWWIIGKAGS